MDSINSYTGNHNQSIKDRRRTKPRQSGKPVRKKSKFDTGNFIAWDGEGLQLDNDTQVYGLLANSRNDYITNVKGLSTQECLDFLTSDKYSKDSIHVCFGASYDINMMLRDVPEEDLRSLHKGDKYVEYDRYQLEYRPRKSLSIRKYKTEIRNSKVYRCYDSKKKRFIFERTVVLWDCFGFFQKKFVAVLKEWSKGTKYEQIHADIIDDIEQGKQRRGNFTEAELQEFVLPYCLNECMALENVMHILHGYLEEAGLKLTRWDGAGAVAAAAMKKEGVKLHIRCGEKLEEEPYPSWVIEAAEYGYFGGWIEAFMFGDFRQKVYHYDICSAYPAATVNLPSLVQGYWKKFTGNMLPISEHINFLKSLPSYWIGHVEWANGPWYGPCPFSWRNSKGSVTRPVQGRGWHWSPEILAAYELFPNLSLKINEVYYFVPDEKNEKPFKFIPEIYELRKKEKQDGKGIQIVRKLEMNSIYGKLAQSLGYDKSRGLKPPYHCIIYAGIITSETRAKMLRACMQAPMSIISMATDGIYSLKPLDLDIGDSLGQWEFTEHESMTVIQPGFYWYVTKGEEKHYYRGFNENCISRGEVIDAFNHHIPSVEVDTTRFVTLGAAIGLNNLSEWRRWRTKKRKLDLMMVNSSKRVWLGDTFPGNRQIKVARNRIFDPQVFIDHPEKLDSKKYEFDWDGDLEQWEGQAGRTIAEDMFAMELSPM